MSNKLIFIFLLTASSAFAQNKGMFVVTRDYRIRPFPEAATIILDWKSLNVQNDFDITENSFGKAITKKIVDINNDNQPDHVVIEYVFKSDEQQYSFSVKPNNKPITFSASNATADARLKITYLKNISSEINNWSDKIIESVMSFNPNPDKYDYETAFFMNAMFVRYLETKNQSYFNYIKKWVDRFIDSHGSLDPKQYKVDEYRLDNLLAGRLFISLYEATKDSRYKGALQQLRQQLQYQPRTVDGGYWYRQSCPYQLWLDGVYMSGIFLMQYGKVFNEPKMFDQAMQQINLVNEHNGDTESGLLFHGFDESGNASWANEDTGTSREFWSRGIAFYYLTLLECIDYIPLENLDRKQLGMKFRELTRPIQKFEDPTSALWYEVINKSYEPRNWFETSASAMFAYGFAKGYNKGILDKSYLAAAQKVFVSLQRDYIFFDDQGRLYLDGTVKTATLDPKVSKGDLDYYVSAERKINDLKGLAALLYLSMELD
ncbi:MAG: glycoside hydrolase family 88 protein [Bacteroidota bacterium]